jgi:hypothetical protein
MTEDTSGADVDWIAKERYYRFADWWMDTPFNPEPPLEYVLWDTTLHQAMEAFGASWQDAIRPLIASVTSAYGTLSSISSSFEKAGIVNHKRKIGKPRINWTGPRYGPAFDRRGRKRY